MSQLFRSLSEATRVADAMDDGSMLNTPSAGRSLDVEAAALKRPMS